MLAIAPWTHKELWAIRRWQFHSQAPYRCNCGPVMDVSEDGLRCPICRTTQDWVWAFVVGKKGSVIRLDLSGE